MIYYSVKTFDLTRTAQVLTLGVPLFRFRTPKWIILIFNLERLRVAGLLPVVNRPRRFQPVTDICPLYIIVRETTNISTNLDTNGSTPVAQHVNDIKQLIATVRLNTFRNGNEKQTENNRN